MRLLTIDAGKDFADEQYMEMYRDFAAGKTDRQVVEELGFSGSHALLTKLRAGRWRMSDEFKACLRAAADNMPPPPMTPAEAVRRHADPNAAVYTTLPEGQPARVVTLSDAPVRVDAAKGPRKPCNPGCKRFAGLSVGAEAKAALQAHRERLGLTWEEMFWLMDEYLRRADW